MVCREVGYVLSLIGGRGPEVLKVVLEELLPVGADEEVPQVVMKVDG